MTLRDSLIENNSILINQEAKTWEEAVKLGTDVLVESGAIEPRYYDEIVKTTKELGPYYMLVPGIAMPHSRPESGVIKDCFAITILKDPVKFGTEDHEYAQILFTLAATSSDAHAEVAIPQIVDLLDDEDNIDKLIAAKTIEDVLKIVG
ncbi:MULTISPECIES: PTS sugar transporter subunit IIA [Psychrilyobacter]|uniref:Ascorbate-specific PTS system EIIA component n=1 Tax=Psychrilyobacter piezotolerans TaxID=2293438 RepID=A0ABX9KG97_9FUSO|nr:MULTISPECIES: PTS sugar transporter subunit IIA [Psychrilyobacter]MCS5422966.1 PTS sugar transporter subunit IIA [Psychrilyobacter sp. S5]RDE61395.1 PTS ascorbate-specific transporter subunit IIA [Psychrilyobacter sp. S5]REI40916.1 PTS ascorbate-specific transporter subunit IIA [Psychrilyobacter piezotolerans]